MRKWLRDLRTEKNITMKQAAQSMGISESYFCSIENGDRQKKMDASIILGLSSVFSVDPSFILQAESKYLNNADA